MDNTPSFDRGILIPVFIGGISVIGILVVLLIGRSLDTPPPVPLTPSPTRFQYVYLGTEPVITTPLIEETQIEPTQAPGSGVTDTPTPSGPSLPTPIILASPTINPQESNTPAPPTATSASAPPLNPGTYDDVDSHLIYTGWNPPTALPGAYGNTLHVSVVPGSTVSFYFIGRQLRLFYQGGSTLGQMRITIDTTSYTLDQSSDNEWVSDLFANGTHSVLITHIGGGSVNLDRVIIPEIPNTKTPTATATRTSIP